MRNESSLIKAVLLLSLAWFSIGIFPVRGDEPVPPVAMFAVPKVELRKEAALKDAGSVAAAEVASESAGDEMILSTERATDISESSIQAFETMNGGLVLRQIPRRDEPAGAIGWVETEIWDPVFAPEVIKVGKVKMTGGVIAAIKRKNPFCLLNPLVFAAGW